MVSSSNAELEVASMELKVVAAELEVVAAEVLIVEDGSDVLAKESVDSPSNQVNCSVVSSLVSFDTSNWWSMAEVTAVKLPFSS